MNSLGPSFLIAALALTACGPLDETPANNDELGTSSSALGMTAADGAQVLALVNYPGTTLATLDTQARLELRAAQNIIARRDGTDGQALTADDHPFATIAELDAVAYVGSTALNALVSYAHRFPAPAGEVVEGVTFAGWESEAVVWGVNHATSSALDGFLDSRAATGLVAARPFVGVHQMGPVSQVGQAALNALKSHARAWWAQMHAPVVTLAGTFDGVDFDEATAVKALALANTATREELMMNGINSNPTSAILGNRPLASLAAVSAVSGVGPATMQSLKEYALAPAVDPLKGLKDLLAPLTADLLFPSETDAQLLFVSSLGIGNAPITESLIRSRLGSQHDLLLPQVMYVDPSEIPLATRTDVEELDGVDYLNRIINDADPNDPASLAKAQRFAQLRDALSSQLSDLKAFRFGKISISIFFVGRTRDGNLAGLLTGVVET